MFNHLGVAFLFFTLFSSTFGFKLTLPFLLIIIFFNYLPDVDIPIELLQRKRLGGKEHGFHREITHYPLLYIPISLLILLTFDYKWAFVFFTCVYSHFILDSIGAGWGIKWLWPFSNDRIKLFAKQKTGAVSTNLIAHWNKKEFLAKSKKYGDDNWFRDLYLKPSPILISELVVLAVGIVTFILTTHII